MHTYTLREIIFNKFEISSYHLFHKSNLNYLQDIYGALTVTPISSGFCLGSSNWLISSDHEKVAFVSGSSTLTTHPKPMDQVTLKHANLLILTGLTQTPTANPDTMLGELCMTVGKYNLNIR